MAGFDPNFDILSGTADYQAEDWLTAGAQGSLNIRPVAVLSRGLDLGITAEALIQLDASIRKFIAIDASAFATASAGVRAQVQLPIDLFNEAGLAIRLQAQAQAAVGAQLGIGLTIRDFLRIVDSDPRLNGAPARLVRVLLEEASITGGVKVKAAVAAMAYVNVSATGRFLKSGNNNPGFTVAVEQGAGWGAGGGVLGFVNFGLNDPRNLIRRSIDVAVDATLDDIAIKLQTDWIRSYLAELRAPLKMTLRTTFELGLQLAANSGNYSPNDGATMALRCAQVFLEEAQRCVLERIVSWAVGQIRRAIVELTFGQAAWDNAAAERSALATLLESLPIEPFEATPANRKYWTDVADMATSVLLALGGQTGPNDLGVTSLASVYASVQLLFITVERVSNASARASVIGVNPAQTAPAFAGP